MTLAPGASSVTLLGSENTKHLLVTDRHPHAGLSWGTRGLEERRDLLKVTEGVELSLGRVGLPQVSRACWPCLGSGTLQPAAPAQSTHGGGNSALCKEEVRLVGSRGREGQVWWKAIEDIHHPPGAEPTCPRFLVMDAAGALGRRIPSLVPRAL